MPGSLDSFAICIPCTVAGRGPLPAIEERGRQTGPGGRYLLTTTPNVGNRAGVVAFVVGHDHWALCGCGVGPAPLTVVQNQQARNDRSSA